MKRLTFIRMRIKIRKNENEYEIRYVTGRDLADAWQKAIAAGHDPTETASWHII